MFYEINKIKHLGRKYALKLIIEKDRNTESNNFDDKKNKKIIEDKISLLKENLGQDFNSLINISFVEFLSVPVQICHFISTDIFLLSDMNIINGMKPLIQEFILVQKELIDKNSSLNKPKGILIGENITTKENLNLIQKVNFAEIDNIKHHLKELINLNSEQRNNIIKSDCERLRKNYSILWLKGLIRQLKQIIIKKKV